jgi:hypothetical protein
MNPEGLMLRPTAMGPLAVLHPFISDVYPSADFLK